VPDEATSVTIFVLEFSILVAVCSLQFLWRQLVKTGLIKGARRLWHMKII